MGTEGHCALAPLPMIFILCVSISVSVCVFMCVHVPRSEISLGCRSSGYTLPRPAGFPVFVAFAALWG